MAGRHAAGRGARRFQRLMLPILTSTAILAVLVGTAGVALSTRSADHRTDDGTSNKGARPGATGSLDPSSIGQRATRGQARKPSASASASASAASGSPSSQPGGSQPRPPAPPDPDPPRNGGTCWATSYSRSGNTTSGERFNPGNYTAAHASLPYNTRIRVTNLANGRSVVVRVNDRLDGAGLGLTTAAFWEISDGDRTLQVRYEIVG